MPDSRWLDRLLRSRLWIWVVALALIGLVAVQVSLLKLNTGISRAVQTAATLERQNAALETQLAGLSASEQVRAGAAARGMVAPLAGDVEYLTIRPGLDSRRAADVMQPPSDTARAVMAGGGVAPAAPVASDPALTTATAAPEAATTVPAAPDVTTAAPADPTTATAPSLAPAVSVPPAGQG